MQTNLQCLVRLLYDSLHHCTTARAIELCIFCFTVKSNCEDIPETLAYELQ